MLPGLEAWGCEQLAVPAEVMHHVVRVESSFNPYAIGVVGGRLQRQPRTLDEAVATARMLEASGRNFSVGLAQVNRHNLAPQGIADYGRAFDACPNLAAGARILADCHGRAGGDWGKAFSCYYSGNFETGFRHGYVDKVFASMSTSTSTSTAAAIPLAVRGAAAPAAAAPAGPTAARESLLRRRGAATPPPASDAASAVAVADAMPPSAPSAPVVAAPFQLSPVTTGAAVPAPLDPTAPQRRVVGDTAFVF